MRCLWEETHIQLAVSRMRRLPLNGPSISYEFFCPEKNTKVKESYAMNAKNLIIYICIWTSIVLSLTAIILAARKLLKD